MRIVRLASVVALLLLGSATNALAQEAGDVGLSMGYPSNVAFIWHVTDRVAIRPEISFAWSSLETEIDTPIEGGELKSDTFTTSFGVSGLFYLGTSDRLRTYVTPRFVYSRASVESEAPFTPDLDSTDDGFQFSGSFGAQYGISDRFGVFGEVGIAYSSMSLQLGLPIDVERETRAFGTRTAVGVTFYF